MILVDPNEASQFNGMKYFHDMQLKYKVYKKVTGIWDFCVMGKKEYDDGRVVKKTFLIERKTWWDFLKSADSRDNHLLKQLKKLAAAESLDDDEIVVPVLLIEGYRGAVIKSRYGKRWPRNRIIYFRAGTFGGWGDKIRFYQTGSGKETVEFLDGLNQNINKEPTESLPYRIADAGPAYTQEDEAYNMIMGKPGIGPKTCKKLFDVFGSVINICNQDLKTLQATIGKKTGRALYDVINLNLGVNGTLD